MTTKRQSILHFGNRIGDDTNPNMMSDPLSSYYSNNQQLVQQDAIVQKVLTFLKMKLFSDGIVFVRDSSILIPPDSLQTNVNHYWIPFLFKTLPFMFAQGFLVFRIYENNKGHMVPDVPDYDLLTIKISYNEKTAAPEVEAKWKDGAYKSNQLYVINCQSAFGITPANQMSPVDAVKPLLLEYYQLVENKFVANFHNARPPMILQHPVMKAPRDAGVNDLSNYDDLIESKVYDNMEVWSKDEFNMQRIRNVSRWEKATYTANANAFSNGMPSQWWIKAQSRQQERPESRFMYVPHGLTYTSGPSSNSEGDYVNIQTAIMEKIFNAFGIPYSAILTSSSHQTATGLELHKTTLINTLKTYWLLYQIILTDVYRLCFDFVKVEVDIDQTKKKRKIDKDKNEDDDDDEIKQPTSEKELFNNKEKSLVQVYLKSQFQTSPEQALALYHEGVISFQLFQQLRLESVGLPVFLTDTSVAPPIRTQAMDMGTTMKLNENAKAVQATKK